MRIVLGALTKGSIGDTANSKARHLEILPAYWMTAFAVSAYLKTMKQAFVEARTIHHIGFYLPDVPGVIGQLAELATLCSGNKCLFKHDRSMRLV